MRQHSRTVSDDAVRQRTGRKWREWFELLDEWGAAHRSHGEIARWLVEDQGLDGWWAQSVTVGYEQERGLRVPGQKSDGTFAASGSKTVAVSAERLFEAFADETVRGRWLSGVQVSVRTATPYRSLRADWDDGTRIAVGFAPQGPGKTQVSVQHEKLTDAEAVARMKTYWRERLAVLAGLLER